MVLEKWEASHWGQPWSLFSAPKVHATKNNSYGSYRFVDHVFVGFYFPQVFPRLIFFQIYGEVSLPGPVVNSPCSTTLWTSPRTSRSEAATADGAGQCQMLSVLDVSMADHGLPASMQLWRLPRMGVAPKSSKISPSWYWKPWFWGNYPSHSTILGLKAYANLWDPPFWGSAALHDA